MFFQKVSVLLCIAVVSSGCAELRSAQQQVNFLVNGKPCHYGEKEQYAATLDGLKKVQFGHGKDDVINKIMPVAPKGMNVFQLENGVMVESVFYTTSRRGCGWDELTEYHFGNDAPIFFVNGQVVGKGHDYYLMKVKPYVMSTNKKIR